MAGSPEPGQANEWHEARLGNEPIEARFIELFDFASYDDPHDLRWVRFRVLGPSGHALVGADVILEFEHVRFDGLT